MYLPCLLERWGGSSASHAGGITWQDVKRDVIRHIEWILNTEVPHSLIDPPWVAAGQRTPLTAEVLNSVLAFGVPAYSGRVSSAVDAEEIAWSIRDRIMAFETRVEASSLEVSVIEGDSARGSFNRLRFHVQGTIRSDPLMEFSLETELSMEDGAARIVQSDR